MVNFFGSLRHPRRIILPLGRATAKKRGMTVALVYSNYPKGNVQSLKAKAFRCVLFRNIKVSYNLLRNEHAKKFDRQAGSNFSLNKDVRRGNCFPQFSAKCVQCSLCGFYRFFLFSITRIIELLKPFSCNNVDFTYLSQFFAWNEISELEVVFK